MRRRRLPARPLQRRPWSRPAKHPRIPTRRLRLPCLWPPRRCPSRRAPPHRRSRPNPAAPVAPPEPAAFPPVPDDPPFRRCRLRPWSRRSSCRCRRRRQRPWCRSFPSCPSRHDPSPRRTPPSRCRRQRPCCRRRSPARRPPVPPDRSAVALSLLVASPPIVSGVRNDLTGSAAHATMPGCRKSDRGRFTSLSRSASGRRPRRSGGSRGPARRRSSRSSTRSRPTPPRVQAPTSSAPASRASFTTIRFGPTPTDRSRCRSRARTSASTVASGGRTPTATGSAIAS